MKRHVPVTVIVRTVQPLTEIDSCLAVLDLNSKALKNPSEQSNDVVSSRFNAKRLLPSVETAIYSTVYSPHI